jgi:hypothetical protein
MTVLIFVGIPAAVVAVVYGAVYGTSARRASKRYRPGRPFEFAPVWFLSAPEAGSVNGHGPAPELTGGPQKEALPGPSLAEADDAPKPHGETGGASDSW